MRLRCSHIASRVRTMAGVCLAMETLPGTPAAAPDPSKPHVRNVPKHITNQDRSFQPPAIKGQKKAFNPHRLVPAQFNEFYRSAPVRPIRRTHLFSAGAPRIESSSLSVATSCGHNLLWGKDFKATTKRTKAPIVVCRQPSQIGIRDHRSIRGIVSG